jgi:DNA-binding beta-propeller fold protein YncE
MGYIISAYTKRGVVISTNYNTLSMLRTMEDLLGIGYISTTDANAEPMSDVFTETPDLTPYQAIVPGSLCALPQGPSLIPACNDSSVPKTAVLPSLHNGKWWAAATKGFDFEVEDKLDVAEFNQILWAGIKGNNIPYPTARSRANLRQNRAQLLNNWHLRASRISAAPSK